MKAHHPSSTGAPHNLSTDTDLLKAVIVNQVRTMAVDEGTEGKSILEAVSR